MDDLKEAARHVLTELSTFLELVPLDPDSHGVLTEARDALRHLSTEGSSEWEHL